jgi:hypothetical protein
MSSYLTTSAAAAGYYPLSGNPSGFLTAASLSGYATETFVTSQGYITSAALTPYLTTSAAASTYYLQTNPAGYITSSALVPYLLSSTAASTYQPLSGMSSYLTTSAAASTYATIAQGQPTAGTVGQVLTKNSGTNYDSSWQTLIPGDRYLTTSTTSNTIGNGTKSFTIGTGLSYTPTQSITVAFDASNHMHGEVLTYNSGTGALSVDINHHTGSGTYTSWTVNVAGVVPAASVTWGSITGTLGDQTDLATALNAKLETSTAASTYAPIASPTFTGVVTIPAGASISGFAPLASPALTGNVTINSNSTGAALFIEQAGTGNILTLHDQASDTNFVAIDQNGKVSTIASDATNGAGFNIAHGVAPTTPVNGDIWTTTSGLFMRQNGTTRQYVDLDQSQTINGNKTFSNATQTLGNSTATGTINVASGATISASTKTVNVGTGGVVGSTTNITVGPVLGASTTSIGGTTATSTLNLATGATLTATTKAVNIGTAGVAGSTTNIAIGSTTGTSTTTLQGITNGVTQTAGDSSLKLATTAFVTTADNLKANLASPAFTGTPSLPTGTTAVTQTTGNNTTAVATTAFVANTLVGVDLSTLLEAKFDGVTPGLSNTGMTAVAARANSNYYNLLSYGSTTATGSVQHWFAPFDYVWYGFNGWNFSKAGHAVFHIWWNVAAGATSNMDSRFYWGRRNTDTIGTNLTAKGFQIRVSLSAGTMTTNFGVHNGTTLTEVSMGNPTPSGFMKYLVSWDGSGNFTCHRNNVLVASTSAGPTGTVNEGNGIYCGIDYKAGAGNTANHQVSYVNNFVMRGTF